MNKIAEKIADSYSMYTLKSFLNKYEDTLTEEEIKNLREAINIHRLRLSRKINENLKNRCQIDGDKTCDCHLWCISKDEQFDSLDM